MNFDSPDYGRIVQVYRNLHKKCWSIRCKKSRLVIGHSNRVLLKNCKLYVSQRGNERVRESKTKNVHAWVEGEWTDEDFTAQEVIKYEPYTAPHFTKLGHKVVTASNVYLSESGAVFSREAK